MDVLCDFFDPCAEFGFAFCDDFGDREGIGIFGFVVGCGRLLGGMCLEFIGFGTCPVLLADLSVGLPPAAVLDYECWVTYEERRGPAQKPIDDDCEVRSVCDHFESCLGEVQRMW